MDLLWFIQRSQLSLIVCVLIFSCPKSGQSNQNHPVLEPVSSILPSMVFIKACNNGDKTINSVVRNICIKCLHMYKNREIFVGIYWFMFLQVIVKVNKEDTQYVTMLLCYYVMKPHRYSVAYPGIFRRWYTGLGAQDKSSN